VYTTKLVPFSSWYAEQQRIMKMGGKIFKVELAVGRKQQNVGNEEETRESVRFVKRLLHRSIWVQVDETRWIFGDFVCLDHLKNLILENSFEVNCEGFP